MAVTSLLGLPIPQMSDSVGKTIPDLASAMQIIDEKLAGSRIVDHNLDVASSPNGKYARWENGLQVCWLPRLTLQKELSNQARDNWTFPAAFVDTNYSVHITQGWRSGDSSATKLTMAFTQARTTSSCIVALGSKDSDLADGESWGVHLVAIGRWK